MFITPTAAVSATVGATRMRNTTENRTDRRRVRVGWLVSLIAAVFLVGAFIGSEGTLGTQALRLLAALGAPQYEAYKDMYADQTGTGTSDYLLFFEKEGRAEAVPYFEAHPDVRVVDNTIFANAVVVSVPEPAKSHLEDLRGQPFTWMVIRDRPFFFCH